MGHEVYADGWEIAGNADNNKSIARFPDVCMSPPSPPAGPIPVPYPDTSFSSDLKEGSQTVTLGGQPAALAQQSYYQPATLGDEAATNAWGGNVVTHVITGKTYFQAWSMDVLIEGKNVCRHLDITTSNQASTGTTTAPAPTISKAALARIAKIICPCCHGAAHANQKGPNVRVVAEAEWYGADGMKKVAESRSKGCRGVPPQPNRGCGVYFVQPNAVQRQKGRKKWDSVYKEEFMARYNVKFAVQIAAGTRTELKSEPDGKKEGEPIVHKVPNAAGGCNKSDTNLQRKSDMSSDCQKLDDDLTKIHNERTNFWR
jgi:hypothetical protein